MIHAVSRDMSVGLYTSMCDYVVVVGDYACTYSIGGCSLFMCSLYEMCMTKVLSVDDGRSTTTSNNSIDVSAAY